MLTQSVRRVQPGKRNFGIFAKPADPLESELWLELGGAGEGCLLSLGTISGLHGNTLLQGIWPTSLSRQRGLVDRIIQNHEAA